MQAVNVVIIRALFLVVFLGTAVATVVLAVLAPDPLHLLAAACYLVGVIGVTAAANVPLNNALDRVAADSAEGERLWRHYLSRWTAWNHVRTVTSTAATAGPRPRRADGRGWSRAAVRSDAGRRGWVVEQTVAQRYGRRWSAGAAVRAERFAEHVPAGLASGGRGDRDRPGACGCSTWAAAAASSAGWPPTAAPRWPGSTRRPG